MSRSQCWFTNLSQAESVVGFGITSPGTKLKRGNEASIGESTPGDKGFKQTEAIL
jgi:hypothetical protein